LAKTNLKNDTHFKPMFTLKLRLISWERSFIIGIGDGGLGVPLELGHGFQEFFFGYSGIIRTKRELR
jgi:hypothetical protein